MSKSMNRKARENMAYKNANEQFLQEKAQEEGVVSLPSGVLYRKLHAGSGRHCPTPGSIIYVNYTGRLIDGTVFDTTEGRPLPACFVLRDLIMGWQIALSRMHEGDRFEVFIPWPYGYGKKAVGTIPGYSTLIFDLELIKFEGR